MSTLTLAGCTPEPLMAYLKALGILRLISAQKDECTRGWWKDDAFWLQSPGLFKDAPTDQEKRDALVSFFLEQYRPTPILVPWSGGDFFDVDWNSQPSKFRKTPTSSKVVESILCSKTARLAPYRAALRTCKAALDQCAIDSKSEMEKSKWAFIESLRSTCENPDVIDWMDAAALIGVERFAALLGSGGGSDGNTHFSDNFMQNLWDVLPDFDDQRESPTGEPLLDGRREQLRDSLFGGGTARLIYDRTSSLYDSGAVGGPNATQGLERKSLSNPWNVILALEGTLCFAGAVVKRLAASARNAAFPFQVSASVTSRDRLAAKERSGTEIWLPLWPHPARSNEVLALLREGRTECGTRSARSGVDMARAAVTLGIDRGLAAFHRYIIVKGRVGGDNYNTGVSLGRFDVRVQPDADLLREIDPWLDAFRRAAGEKAAPERLGEAVRRIDTAILDFCRYGGPSFFQQIVIALGRAERALTLCERFREERRLRPVAGLSPQWADAADDGSSELHVARALSTVHDEERKIGPLRANLEPVDWKAYCRFWAEKDRTVVWNAADLATNMASLLQRRLIDATRAGCEHLPLGSRFAVPLPILASFLHDQLDDDWIEALLWGLMLIGPGRRPRLSVERIESDEMDQAEELPLPRDFALLKLLFLPRPLVAYSSGDTVFWRLAHRLPGGLIEAGLSIRPEPRVLPLLRAGRIGEACKIAAQRLRTSGLPPMPAPARGVPRDGAWGGEMKPRSTSARRGARLAAALLIPIASVSVNHLVNLVCRDHQAAAEALALSAEGEPE